VIGLSSERFDVKNYWRAVILYGVKMATYKIALGQASRGNACSL